MHVHGADQLAALDRREPVRHLPVPRVVGGLRGAVHWAGAGRDKPGASFTSGLNELGTTIAKVVLQGREVIRRGGREFGLGSFELLLELGLVVAVTLRLRDNFWADVEQPRRVRVENEEFLLDPDAALAHANVLPVIGLRRSRRQSAIRQK